MKDILLVLKKSAFELYSQQEDVILKNHVQRDSEDAKRKKESHLRQMDTIENVVSVLEKNRLLYDTAYIDELRPIRDYGLVISCGGDGTMLDISRYISDNTPVLGVNTDPILSEGYFCTSDKTSFESSLERHETLEKNRLNRVKLSVNCVDIDYHALNDIYFQNENPGLPLKERLCFDGITTDIRSSGLLISTAAGSTGRMYREGGMVMPISSVRFQYHALGNRGGKPEFSEEMTIQPLTPKGNMYIDGGRCVIGFKLDDMIMIRKGLPLTVLGNLEEKRRLYL